MKVEHLKISHHSRMSDVTFYKPDGKDKFPLVIMSHGFNGHKEDHAITAKYFADNGIAVICHTFCGGGIKAEGDFATTQMTLFTEKEDLTAILEEAKQWECIDIEKIFLFGASMGGMVSAMTAEENADTIKGLILLYPALCIADDWRKNFRTEEDIPKNYNLWGVNLGSAFFEVIREYYIEKNLGNYNKPVLIMHGTEDEVVPVSYGKWAASHYKNARLEVFHKEGHGFSYEGDRRMEAMMMYFIHNNM